MEADLQSQLVQSISVAQTPMHESFTTTPLTSLSYLFAFSLALVSVLAGDAEAVGDGVAIGLAVTLGVAVVVATGLAVLFAGDASVEFTLFVDGSAQAASINDVARTTSSFFIMFVLLLNNLDRDQVSLCRGFLECCELWTVGHSLSQTFTYE